jgi:hypothetical protein
MSEDVWHVHEKVGAWATRQAAFVAMYPALYDSTANT